MQVLETRCNAADCGWTGARADQQLLTDVGKSSSSDSAGDTVIKPNAKSLSILLCCKHRLTVSVTKVQGASSIQQSVSLQTSVPPAANEPSSSSDMLETTAMPPRQPIAPFLQQTQPSSDQQASHILTMLTAVLPSAIKAQPTICPLLGMNKAIPAGSKSATSVSIQQASAAYCAGRAGPCCLSSMSLANSTTHRCCPKQ